MHSSSKTAARVMGFSHGTTPRRPIISLTPLIDVVFILLVFFMLASSFLDWRSVAVTIAKPASITSDNSPMPLILSVNDTETWLDGEPLPIDAIIARVQLRLEVEPVTVINILPLGDTPLQPVISVLDQLVDAGLTNFSMIRDTAWQPHVHSALRASMDD